MARSTKPVKKAAKAPAKKAPVKKAAGKSRPIDAPPWPEKGKKLKAVVTPLTNNVPTKNKAVPADAMKLVEELAKANAKTRKTAAAYAEAKEAEDAIRSDIVALFGKKKIDGLKHKLGTVSIYTTEYAVIDNMEALLKYAKLKGNSDLLTVGASTKAVKARWEDGKEVPGVSKGKREDLRFTPVKK